MENGLGDLAPSGEEHRGTAKFAEDLNAEDLNAKIAKTAKKRGEN